MERYSFRAVLNVIGAFSEFSTASGDHSKPSYSHITWPQLKEAAACGTFELGNHSYNMHKYTPRYGIAQNKGESAAAYRAALRKDVMRLQDKLTAECGVTPVAFAYPFGKYSRASEGILTDLGFKVIFTCCEGCNLVTRGGSFTKLKRYNRASALSRAEFFERIERDALTAVDRYKGAACNK